MSISRAFEDLSCNCMLEFKSSGLWIRKYCKVDVFVFSLCDFAKTQGRGVFGVFFNDPFLVHWFSLVDAESEGIPF